MTYPEFQICYCIDTVRADIHNKLVQTHLYAFDLSLSRNFHAVAKIDLKPEIDTYSFLLSIVDFCQGRLPPQGQPARRIENETDRLWFSEAANKYLAQHQLGIAPALIKYIDVLRDCLYYLRQYEVVNNQEITA